MRENCVWIIEACHKGKKDWKPAEEFDFYFYTRKDARDQIKCLSEDYEEGGMLSFRVVKYVREENKKLRCWSTPYGDFTFKPVSEKCERKEEPKYDFPYDKFYP